MPGSIISAASRQGFPEVVFGQGKTPGQIAAIAERIVAAGHNLLVTRTDPEAFDAVRAATARSVSFTNWRDASHCDTAPLPPGRGTILIAAAGTADLPVAEEAAVTAEIMGNTRRPPVRRRRRRASPPAG